MADTDPKAKSVDANLRRIDQKHPGEGDTGQTPMAGPFQVDLHPRLFRRNKDEEPKDSDLTGVWEWSYFINSKKPPSVQEHELAHKISRLAGSLHEAGFVADSTASDFPKNAKPSDLAALDIMEQLVGVFRAALQGNRGGDDLTIYTTMVDDLEKDFFRRVITARMRSRLIEPVRLTVLAFLAALLLGFLTPMIEARFTPAPPEVVQTEAASTATASTVPATAPDKAAEAAEQDSAPAPKTPWDLFQALCFVTAGTLMGRLLFFALTHNGRVENYDQHYALKAQLNAPEITLLFDFAIGATAFAVFQTGFIVIAIGGEADNLTAGISTLQIADKGLVAFVFGILVGISRIAFLGRVKAISEEKLSTGK